MITQRIHHRLHLCIIRLQMQYTQSFSCVPALGKGKPMPPRPSVAENEIVEVFLKGSGPGGQKINKTASAVQLKHLPTGLVVKSQATRSREQNRKIARNILAMKLDERFNGPESRQAKLVEKAHKKKASKAKKAKRKYTKWNSEEKAVNGETTESDLNETAENGLGDGEEISLDAVTAKEAAEEKIPEAPDETDEGPTGLRESPNVSSYSRSMRPVD